MFALPLQGTPAREAMGDIAYVAEILAPGNIGKLQTFGEALAFTRRNFPEGAKAVNVICLRADDERWLISVGPKGGWRKVWNFGNGRSASVLKAAHAHCWAKTRHDNR